MTTASSLPSSGIPSRGDRRGPGHRSPKAVTPLQKKRPNPGVMLVALSKPQAAWGEQVQLGRFGSTSSL